MSQERKLFNCSVLPTETKRFENLPCGLMFIDYTFILNTKNAKVKQIKLGFFFVFTKLKLPFVKMETISPNHLHLISVKWYCSQIFK